MMKFRVGILALFAVLAIASALLLPKLRFSFDFEQFFPSGDPDLAFFKEFIKEFEADDNFMLVALRREEGAFEQQFLENVHDLTLKSRDLPHVLESNSLTKFSYPIKTPFAIVTTPAIHISEPEYYERDRERLLKDERFVRNLISTDGKTLVVFLKTVSNIQLDQARELMQALDSLVTQYNFEEFHYLGRPYFQKEMVDMQIREIKMSFIVSGVLVVFILFLIFRRPIGVAVAISAIGLGLLLFMGLLSALGRELNAMAALYPVLMIIVGTSDVIHIMSKYIDERNKGRGRDEAILITLKEIGLAVFLTSATTAIGFASLFTNRIPPIRDFGINAAIGVLVAYITSLFFLSALLSFFRADQITVAARSQIRWQTAMLNLYQFTDRKKRSIVYGFLAALLICFSGMALVNTNYNITNNLPKNAKITADFLFFQQELASFRPMEIAVYAQGDYLATDYAVVREIDKTEQYLRTFPDIQAIGSITALFKSIHQMNHGNAESAYRMPNDSTQFGQYRRLLDKIPASMTNVMISRDETKTRITSRIGDVGADSIKNIGLQIDQWVAANTDTSVVKFYRTGTGLIIDKNAEYARKNLIQGLLLAIALIGILMALLFRDLRMTIVFLLPNIFPLLVAAAIMGFAGIELEAGVSIIFTVVFGIAVDDTIHFLSRFKIARSQGQNVESSIKITFLETGKPMVLTSVILFFGFLVMLFSVHPPSVIVGTLISSTLLSALVGDLLLTPVLIRWLVKEEG
ncbi:MAG: MMPL family transporter [Saprospiraceae bacterium]|nr:MMPL family transporter [Saprospiraceae bacterium]